MTTADRPPGAHRNAYRGLTHMNTYTIANNRSGVILGVFWCSSKVAALDMMAQDAGYTDYAALCRVVPPQDDELSITEG